MKKRVASSPLQLLKNYFLLIDGRTILVGGELGRGGGV